MPIHAHRGGGANALLPAEVIDTSETFSHFGTFSSVSDPAPDRPSGSSNHSWREIARDFLRRSKQVRTLIAQMRTYVQGNIAFDKPTVICG
jgi:hypothetical protein